MVRKISKVEKIMRGEEPDLSKYDDLRQDDARISIAYSWYSYYYELSDGLKWLEEYLKQQNYNAKDIHKIVNSKKITAMTICSFARCCLRGAKMPKSSHEFFKSRIQAILDSDDVISIPEIYAGTTPTIGVKERTQERIYDLIGMIDQEVDTFITTFNSDFNIKEFVTKHNLKPKHLEAINSYYYKQLKEIDQARAGIDLELKEGYSKYTKRQLSQLGNFFSDIIDTTSNTSIKLKKKRKLRKKKVKPLEEVVKKVQYLKNFDELNLISISPIKIIGAQELWLYNTKYRQLTHLVAIDHGGLNVKGTSVIDYDEKKSVMKRIRKPEIISPEIKNAGKVSALKTFDGLKTTATKANGRINEYTIILKVN